MRDALAHPDVLAAFGAAPILYGSDSPPVDGTVYRVEVNGKTIDIGDTCTGTLACTPIPLGVVAELGERLKALEAQQRALADCKSRLQ